jgi:hypothetical protein
MARGRDQEAGYRVKTPAAGDSSAGVSAIVAPPSLSAFAVVLEGRHCARKYRTVPTKIEDADISPGVLGWS